MMYLLATATTTTAFMIQAKYINEKLTETVYDTGMCTVFNK